MKPYLSPLLREQIARQGKYRCACCLGTEELAGMPMTVDHIVPSAAGGPDTEDNLCLACRRCNEFRGTQTHACDPESDETVRLFNPRQQKWNEHFQWSEDGTEIVGKTACGRATITALRMNNPEIMVARRLWVSVGWWPPDD
ncbi:HNH endonuclease [Desulfonema magnum]|uniref:HNH endonuclease domain-containing protein n=1 Tax=Desulfonema magnum TaxID=45655 RepID=A0A975BKF1_9BACT|nr:HNH endonuclease signature motif containing protein [Desulfonema magnum]QTA87036.1 HNH endonuclease domain-containing protein [Desulfonema magnum]